MRVGGETETGYFLFISAGHAHWIVLNAEGSVLYGVTVATLISDIPPRLVSKSLRPQIII